MKVVTYDPKYKTAFRDLNLQWIEEHFKVEKKDREQLDNPEEICAGGGEVFFMVSEHGEAIATAAMIKMLDGGFEIAKMAVRPDFRGKKLGDILMNLVEAWARDKNASRIYLISNTELEPAIALYLKHGFTVISVGQNAEYERGNIEMEKRF